MFVKLDQFSEAVAAGEGSLILLMWPKLTPLTDITEIEDQT